MANPSNLISSFISVSLLTLISRIMGFFRDILIASLLGAGGSADAFLIAFSLPNMFRRFFAEGAFNMAFIPMFSKKLKNVKEANKFAQDAFSGLASILIVLTCIAQLTMPWLIWALASGFGDNKNDPRFVLAVEFGYICFPYILFISLAALLSGILNANGRFFAAAAAPMLLNILLIAAMVFAHWAGMDIALALAWMVPLAGIAQLAMLWFASAKAGFRMFPQLPCLTPDMKKIAIIAAPAVMAGGVVQINLLVGRQIASYSDSAISWLYYADRLYQLPLGVIGIAIGTVLLPDLSRKLSTEDMNGSRNAFNRAFEFALVFTLPAATALSVTAHPLVSVLFERGEFTINDTDATSSVLIIYALGLPAFVMQKVLQPLFFARENTKTPFYYAAISMLLNVVIAISLSYWIGYVAAAWGVTISAWVMVALLWFGSRKMGKPSELDARLIKKLPKILIASLLMGLGLMLLRIPLDAFLYIDGLRYIALALLIICGVTLYGIFLLGIKAYYFKEVQHIIFSRKSS